MAVSVKLDPEEQERLRLLAEAKQRKPHFLMREAIRQYLDREEARESFHQEALASWAEYRETGRHHTADDIDAWLESWGTENETALPKWRE